jgi:hypothetical protein
MMTDRVRQALISQATPFLTAGEQVRHIFQAARGENPWVGAWSTILRFPRLIVVTDTAIVVLSTRWMGKPDAVLVRLPRSTRLALSNPSIWPRLLVPLMGRQELRLNGERLWANISRDEIASIDLQVDGAPATAAAGQP